MLSTINVYNSFYTQETVWPKDTSKCHILTAWTGLYICAPLTVPYCICIQFAANVIQQSTDIIYYVIGLWRHRHRWNPRCSTMALLSTVSDDVVMCTSSASSNQSCIAPSLLAMTTELSGTSNGSLFSSDHWYSATTSRQNYEQVSSDESSWVSCDLVRGRVALLCCVFVCVL